jgi:O-antigen ligase
MIIANQFFYHAHRDLTFLFLTMDAHAIFYVRLIISVVPLMFFVDTNEFKETKAFKVILAAIVGTNALFTFRAVRFFPDAIRARATMEYIGGEAYLFATPDYAMVYGMALIFPVFLQKMKNAPRKSKERYFYMICAALIFYVVLVSQFATALLIAIIGTLVFFLIGMRNNKRMFIISIIIFTVLTLRITGLDVITLKFLASNISGTWADKLNDFALTLSGDALTGSLSFRSELYMQSLNTFLQSPLAGIMAKPFGSLGGHATAIDILGLSGLFGFIPFLLTFIYNVKRICRTCNFRKNNGAIIACAIEFLVLVLSKNIITSLSVFLAFFVLIPFLLKIESDDTGERIR